MLYIRTILFSLSFMFVYLDVLATEQIPDLVIIERDTFYMSGVLKEEFLLHDLLKDKEYKDKFDFDFSCGSTGCYRGYQAIWRIKKGELYLEKVIDCCTERQLNLRKIFKKKLRKAKRVKAYWVSSTFELSSKPFYIFYYVLEMYEEVEFITLKVEKGRLLWSK